MHERTLTLLALTAAASMPAGRMKPGEMMKSAPMFRCSAVAGMNMMTAGTMHIPNATLIYAGENSVAVFSFYDKAIKAEGRKTGLTDGEMIVRHRDVQPRHDGA